MNLAWPASVLYVCVSLLYPEASRCTELPAIDTYIRQVSYLSWQQPRFSTQNPDNRFLGLTRYQAHTEIRPDIYLTGSRTRVMLKPRAYYEYRWDDFGRDSDIANQEQSDIYLNEALFQLKITPEFFTSYGRENLQWGPAFLRSPSNPFFLDNGRDNPKTEIEGKDFLKAVYLPNDWLTISAISNLWQGRLHADKLQARESFKSRSALKVDVIDTSFNASLILSRSEAVNTTLGGFLQATLSDALIAYFDAALYRGNAVLYPRLDAGHPLGGYFERRYLNTSENRFTGLAGLSYTLTGGSTISIEYLYNGTGYNTSEAEDYYELRRLASSNTDNATLYTLARSTLGSALNTGSLLLRRNYLFAQYLFNEPGSDLSYTVRWTGNMDDQSSRMTAIIEYACNENLQAFTIASYYNGQHDSEFTSLLRGEVMTGIEYTF